AVPLRVAVNVETETFAVADVVFLFQLFADRDIEDGLFAVARCPSERVLVVADVRSQRSAFVLVAPVAGKPVRFPALLELEERAPRLVVLPNDLLGGRTADDAFVFAVVVVGFPNRCVDVRVGEILPSSVVGFVPQGSGSVQQSPKALRIRFGARNDPEDVDALHSYCSRMYCSIASFETLP